jgi:hypothetical protein
MAGRKQIAIIVLAEHSGLANVRFRVSSEMIPIPIPPPLNHPKKEIPMSRSLAVALIASVGLASSASHAQQFVNRDFSSGDLTGWTIEFTPNGTTTVQQVVPFDIDGPGPLASSLAARVNVGQAVFTSGSNGGIELFQMLELTEGVQYAVSINFAASHFGATSSNTDGGTYTLFVEGTNLQAIPTGNIHSGCIKPGFLEGLYTPSTTGPHRVGIRIIRNFTPSGLLQQFVDNAHVGIAALGACCLPTGLCDNRTAEACASLQGTFAGAGTQCATTVCAPIPLGACCVPGGGCTDLTRFVCLQQNGTYMGDNTACGVVQCAILLETLPAQTTFSEASAGAFFDLSTTQTLTVVRFDYTSSAAIDNVGEVEIWTRPGSYVGFIGSSSGWTLHDTVAFTSAGTGVMRTRLTLNNPLVIEGNSTVGIYMLPLGGGIRSRGTGSLPVQTFYTDTILSIFTDAVSRAPWSGIAEPNRAWSGGVFYTLGGSTGGCYANCDASTVQPILNVDDFTCFVNEYAAGQNLPSAQQIASYANCDQSTIAPVLNIDDFTCFVNQFAQGCP